MSFTAEQKSQLAKLMATENLTVQHQKIHTAKFDPINRVLYLPIWQNMSGDLYDLLTGHEVGHALYTPAEGWHTAATDKTKPKSYKNFLNVVEDARIEKKVKRRYPGLKTGFLRAYNELFDRDFFGIKNRSVNGMAFIDRLNIFTKSQYTANWIEFKPEEKVFIEKISNIETWDDVVKLTDEIFEYSKGEQFEMQNYDFDYDPSEFDQDGYESEECECSDSNSDDDGEEENGQKQKNAKTSVESDDGDEGESAEDLDASADGEESDSGQSEEFDDDDNGSSINREKESRTSSEDQFVPECVTDEEFRKRENLLLDEKSKRYLYLNVPKVNLETVITPYARVIEQMEDYYFANNDNYIRFEKERAKQLVADFKNRNERFIGLLVKEFEMRKAAKAFSKSRICDTGDIDINKLSSYKFDDNIFRKVMLTPKGKSHGLVLLLDKSGSMSDNMPGSIEQILVLAMFCRKVNIPFIVYGFGCSESAFNADHKKHYSEHRSFSQNNGELSLADVYLREYLNSSMSNFDFNRAVRSMLVLKAAFENRWIGKPVSEELSNTPLTQAIFASGEIMKRFRQKHNLDLASLVIVHDGDSDDTNRYNVMDDGHDEKLASSYSYRTPTNRIIQLGFNITYENVIVQDVSNKFNYKLQSISRYDPMLLCALEWFKKTTGSKVFGFFLTGSGRSAKMSIHHRYVSDDGLHFDVKRYQANQKRNYTEVSRIDEEVNTLAKKLKIEKFLACKTLGYNDFFIVAGGSDLNIDNEEIEVEGKVTASKLKNAFMKYNKKRLVNRVLVSRFIQGIAA
jgi:hypothetical protein